MTVAVFSYQTWATRYPTLAATVSSDQAAAYFDDAGAYCDNTDCSPVPCDPVTFQPRLKLLNMLVAHLAELESPARQGTVGRVSQASQGSVSATLEMAPADRGADWYKQTPYGANFWQASMQYRLGGHFF